MAKYLALVLLSFFTSCQPPLPPDTSSQTQSLLKPFEALPSQDPLATRHALLLYQVQQGKYVEVLKKLQNPSSSQGREKHQLLALISEKILHEGLKSKNFEHNALALYGCFFSYYPPLMQKLASHFPKLDPRLQLMTVRLLKNFEEDSALKIIEYLMGSPYPFLRLELAYELSTLRVIKSYERLFALYHKSPEMLHPFFPELFLRSNSPKSMEAMKGFLSHPDDKMRAATLKALGDGGKTSFYPLVLSLQSDSSLTVKEALAYCLGKLAPLHDPSALFDLQSKGSSFVRLAASKALCQLEEFSARQDLLNYAQKGNLFAYHLLEGGREEKRFLKKMCQSTDRDKRLNAAVALLHLNDPHCLGVMEEIFLASSSQEAIERYNSPGACLHCYEYSPLGESMQDLEKKIKSQQIKQQWLQRLPELEGQSYHIFFDLLLERQALEWIPQIIHLLVEDSSKASQLLFEKYLNALGAPLVRRYCQLALYRLQPSKEGFEALKPWVHAPSFEALTAPFKPLPEWKNALTNIYELSPEQNTQLIIDTYQTLLNTYSQDALTLLIEALSQNPSSSLLAGLILQTVK